MLGPDGQSRSRGDEKSIAELVRLPSLPTLVGWGDVIEQSRNAPTLPRQFVRQDIDLLDVRG